MLYKFGIHEAMSGSGVNEGGEAESRVGDERGSERDAERARVRKSSCVESNNLEWCTRRVNAVLSVTLLYPGYTSFTADYISLPWSMFFLIV